MANENLETIGSFNIQDTFEMGAGDKELLSDLFAPETSTASPDDVQEIKDKQPEKSVVKPIDKKEKEEFEKTGQEEKTGQDLISSFLGDDDDDDEPELSDKESAGKDKKSNSDDKKDDEDDEEISQFAALANDLYNLGVFTKDEDEAPINTPEEFLEKFKSEKQRGAIEILDNFIGQFGEDYKQAFDAIFVKGVNPKEYFNTYNTIVNFAELDMTDETNQERVIRQALIEQDYSSEEIDEEIERIKNYGDLEVVANRHHKALVKKEAKKLEELKLKSEQEQQQRLEFKKQYINNVQNILQEKLKAKEFDGIPINPQLANELQDFLLTDKYKTSSGELITDFDRAILELKRPENHAQKVKVALLLKILEKDPTLSTIQKAGVSKKSNELFESVARQKGSSKTNVNKNQPSSWWTK